MQDTQYWICINTVDPRMWLIGEKKVGLDILAKGRRSYNTEYTHFWFERQLQHGQLAQYDL